MNSETLKQGKLKLKGHFLLADSKNSALEGS